MRGYCNKTDMQMTGKDKDGVDRDRWKYDKSMYNEVMVMYWDNEKCVGCQM